MQIIEPFILLENEKGGLLLRVKSRLGSPVVLLSRRLSLVAIKLVAFSFILHDKDQP